MDAFEQKIRQQLKEDISSVCLTNAKKEALRASMTEQLQISNLGLWHRFVNNVRMFWESTFEIPLAPIAAAVCIMLVVAGVKWLPPRMQSNPQPSAPSYFVRQTDAGIEITPLYKEREVR